MIDCYGNYDSETQSVMLSLGGFWEEGFSFYLQSIYYGFWNPARHMYGHEYYNRGYDIHIWNPNDWVNFIFSKKGFQSFIYLNGTLVSSIDYVPNVDVANQRDIFLGAMSGNGYCGDIWYPLDGALDDVRIYDISISDDQALAIFTLNNDINPKNCILSINPSEIVITGTIKGNEIGVKFKFPKVCPGGYLKYKAYIGSKNKSSLSQLELKPMTDMKFWSITFKDYETNKYDCSTTIVENLEKTLCTIYFRAFAEEELVFEHILNLNIERDLKFNITTLWNSVGDSSTLSIGGQIKYFDWKICNSENNCTAKKIYSKNDNFTIVLNKRQDINVPSNVAPVLIKAVGRNSLGVEEFDILSDVKLVKNLDDTWEYSIVLTKFSGDSYIFLEFGVKNSARILASNINDTANDGDLLKYNFYIKEDGTIQEIQNEKQIPLYYYLLPIGIVFVVIFIVSGFFIRRKIKKLKDAISLEKKAKVIRIEQTESEKIVAKV